MTKPSTAKKIVRKQVLSVWIGEAAYAESNWLTLWTTCRLTRQKAKDALLQHPNVEEYHKIRVARFIREREGRGINVNART